MSYRTNNPFTLLEIIPNEEHLRRSEVNPSGILGENQRGGIILHRDEFEELAREAKILADLGSEFNIVLRSSERYNYIMVREDLTKIGNAAHRTGGVMIVYDMYKSVLERLELRVLLLGQKTACYQVFTPWQYQKRWRPRY